MIILQKKNKIKFGLIFSDQTHFQLIFKVIE